MLPSYLLCTVKSKNLNLTDANDLKVKTERSWDWLLLFSINLVSNIAASAKPKCSLVSRASLPEMPLEPGCSNVASVTSSEIQGFYPFVLIKFPIIVIIIIIISKFPNLSSRTMCVTPSSKVSVIWAPYKRSFNSTSSKLLFSIS